MTDIAKPLPSNHEAERAVLCTCMTVPEAAIEAVSLLRAEEFHMAQHRRIFDAVLVLVAQSIYVDVVTVTEALQGSGQLESAGGAAYVSSLLDPLLLIKGKTIASHAAIIRRTARLRKLIYVTQDIQDRAFKDDAHSSVFYRQHEDSDSLIEEAVSQILGIAGDGNGPAAVRKSKDVAASAVAEFAYALHHPDLAKRISFGIPDLDEFVGGLQRKELVVIVAPTSNGKTLLAGQLAHRASHDGFKVMFFSAEMPSEQVVMRELAYRAGVPFHMVRRPEKATETELQRLEEAAGLPYDIDWVDNAITPARIWAMSEAAKRTRGLDLVVVDYDQLVIEAGMNPDADDDNIFRHQRAFVFAAKRLAQRLDICFVFLSQLRKIPPAVLKGARPCLDDIWGNSSVRNTPQVILWLSREYFTHEMKPEFERKAKVHVMKTRNDRTGVVDLEFDPDYVRFLDAPPTEADSTKE